MQSEADWKMTIATMVKAKVLEPGWKPAQFFTNDYLDAATIKSLGGS